MNGISGLIKETPETSLALSATWRYSENMAVYGLRNVVLPELNLLAPWSWTYQLLELWEINFCCHEPPFMAFCYSSPTGLRHKNTFLGVVGSPQGWIQASDKTGGLSLNLVFSFPAFSSTLRWRVQLPCSVPLTCLHAWLALIGHQVRSLKNDL